MTKKLVTRRCRSALTIKKVGKVKINPRVRDYKQGEEFLTRISSWYDYDTVDMNELDLDIMDNEVETQTVLRRMFVEIYKLQQEIKQLKSK